MGAGNEVPAIPRVEITEDLFNPQTVSNRELDDG
jgi:hypothetical protein